MTEHRSDRGSDIDVAHDEEPRETLVLLQRTQDAVNRVFTRFHGHAPATRAAQPGRFEDGTPDSDAAEPLDVDLREVEAALREEIDLAGLPEQPAPWVNNTAAEIAAGRTVVVDARTV